MQALGARCDVCPLRTEGKGPCASELLPGVDRIAVSQEPGTSEIQADRPFAGRAGAYLDKALVRIGSSRYSLSTTSLVACMPPGGNIQAYEAKLRTRNNRRLANGEPLIPSPTECCAPRLHREIAPYSRVLPMGTPAAARIVPGLRAGILAARGRLVEVPSAAVDPRPFLHDWAAMQKHGLDPARVPGRQILPLLNPSYVNSYSEWDDAFIADLDRAWRWWDGPVGAQNRLRTYNTRMVYRPDPDFVEAVLLGRDVEGFRPLMWGETRDAAGNVTHPGTPTHVHDYETDGIHALAARRRCLGIGTTEWGIIIPYDPVQWARETRDRAKEAARIRVALDAAGWSRPDAIAESHRRAHAEATGGYHDFYTMEDGSRLPLYTPAEQARIDRIIERWMLDSGVLKIGWNSGAYDRIVAEHWHNGIRPMWHLDGILVKKSVLPELPNDLGTTGSILTDMHDWKGDHTAVHAANDEVLWRYCVYDNVVPADASPRLYAQAVQRQQIDVIAQDTRGQDHCVAMHYVGMLVDQVERERLDLVLASPRPVRVRSGKLVCGADGKPIRNADGTPVPEVIDLPMGAIHKWTLQVRRLLQSADVDVSKIVSRTRKEDARNEEWLRQADLDEREAADEDGDDTDAFPGETAGFRGVLPSASELSLDTLAFNPMSHPQLRAVLFEEWDLPIPTDLAEKELYTSSGEISTGDAVLRRMYVDPRLTAEQRAFLKALRMTRRHAKVWGTYVRPFRLPTGDDLLDRGCRVWSDGRLHPSWNAHTAITGRYASSGPNAQNLPPIIKALIVAALGHLLVGADSDQIELRIGASRWKVAALLEAFATGLDPYQMAMDVVMGGKDRIARYQGAPSAFGRKDFAKGSEFERARKLAKQIHLASQYAAGCGIKGDHIEVVDISTVFRLVTSAEDKKTGELEFPELTERDVGRLHDNWLRGFPEYIDGWMEDVRTVRRQGFIVDPVSGRRRDFAGERARKLNEIVNFCCQTGASGLMNRSMDQVRAALPLHFAGPYTGVNNQTHDFIMVETPEAESKRVAGVLREAMNVTHPAFPGMTFGAKPDIALRSEDPLGMGQSRMSAC